MSNTVIIGVSGKTHTVIRPTGISLSQKPFNRQEVLEVSLPLEHTKFPLQSLRKGEIYLNESKGTGNR